MRTQGPTWVAVWLVAGAWCGLAAASAAVVPSPRLPPLQSPFFDAAGAWRPYRKMPNSDVPFTGTPATDATGGVPELAARCGATPGCVGFNSRGSLKTCVGCDVDPSCCVFPQGQPFAAADGVDLFVANGRAPPAEWIAGINDGSLLYAEPEPAHQGHLCYMPEVGNGYTASIVGFGSTHVGGIFTGACGATHKARLPSPVAGLRIVKPAPDWVQGALDTRRGVYKRRYHFVKLGQVVEQTIFAHRTRRHVLVSELELLLPATTTAGAGGRTPAATLNVSLETTFDAGCGQTGSSLPCRLDGNGCAGHFDTTDIVWETPPADTTAARGVGRLVGDVTLFTGRVAHATDDAAHPMPNISIAMPVSLVPHVDAGASSGRNVAAPLLPFVLTAGTRLTLPAALVTSLPNDHPGQAGLSIGAAAQQLLAEAVGNSSTLRDEHEAAWAVVHRSRVEVSPLSSVAVDDNGGNRQPPPGDAGAGDVSAICPNPGGREVKRPDGSTYPYYGLACQEGTDCGQCWVEHKCLCGFNATAKRDCCQPVVPPAPAPAPCPSPAPIAPAPFPTPTAYPLFHAWEIQRHYWTSMYYLVSSQRADWPHGGLSPGGLSSDNYEGAVFMDMEVYMAAGLLLLHPPLAAAAAQYRINGLPAAQHLSSLFGYSGAMFPWTSAASGYAFGCCDGNKQGEGFEDCIEQHITPDVSFSMQQIFRATGDVDWLRSSGAYDAVAGVADWIKSRVSPKDAAGTYHIRGIMPIDEWCLQSTGCAGPGVDDDPQMNGASIAALRFAVEASTLLGKPVDPAWLDIADNLALPFNATLGVHIMPSGPDGQCVVKEALGFHDTSSATSCPEDVNFLSYPWGPSLNISEEVVGNNMRFWSPGTRTCLENAGMTGPIHTVAWLKASPQNVTGAHRALNRSMLAAVYGPFNVRNEVDKHNTTVGGHFDNAHFLTGDGGFVQALVNGYGGLMLAHQEGMKLSQPVLPEGVGELRIVGVHYRGFLLDMLFDGAVLTMNATALPATAPAAAAPAGTEGSAAGSALCIGWPYDPSPTVPQHRVCLTEEPLQLASVEFPAKLYPSASFAATRLTWD